MPTDFAFRLSTYLTLFLSCATLGYAEWDLLPEAAVFAFIVAGLLGVAFHQEGKLELSLKSANGLGIVIGIVAIVWLVFQIVRPSGGLIYSLPWPASMLPYIGPLVMILMPAKLFRPKHIGDWWTMHGVGLAAVALGCAMADDLAFGLFAAAYLIAGAWSLSLFFLRRAAGTIQSIPGRESHELQAVVVTGENSTAPQSRLGRAFATRPLWALAVASGIGAILFFATPRIEGPTWNLARTREVGYGGDETAPDLNRSGTLKGTNREVAFEAVVRNADGSPKDDLPGNQRWRGREFLDYQNGKWAPNTLIRVLYARGVRSGNRTNDESSELPRAVTGEWTIDYRWISRKRDAVVADPLMWTPGEPSPVVSYGVRGIFPWGQMPSGSFYPFSREPFDQYRQIVLPPSEPDVGPVFELMNWNPLGPDGTIPAGSDPFSGHEILTIAKLPSLKEYARNLLERLVKEEKIAKEVLTRLDPASRTVARVDHEIVSRAISTYLSDSGEYEYSLKTPAVERGLDPIEDFLTKSKVGSCERFATALVQLLRSLGIPCKMIVGFKGAEYQEGGKYLVRQEMTHAWVEVLVQRPTPTDYVSYEPPTVRVGGIRVFTREDGANGTAPLPLSASRDEPKPKPQPRPPFLYAWRSLDPTPGGDDATSNVPGFAGSVQSLWASFGEWFHTLIVKYDPEARKKVADATWAWTVRWWPVVMGSAVASLLALVFYRVAVRASAKRKASVGPVTSLPDWYVRFTSLAANRSVMRTPTETPLEHAARFAATLPREFESWTTHVAELIAAERYGGRPTAAAALAEVEAGLTKLAPK